MQGLIVDCCVGFGGRDVDVMAAQLGTERPAAKPRPLRADAKRNRDKLVAVATRAFAEGVAEVSLEQIARDAGVGIGTLYRNFPTRELLVLAVYEQQIDDLDRLSSELAESDDPVAALRTWMLAFTDYVAVKRGLIALLRSMIEADGSLLDAARAKLRDAADRLLAAAAAAGAIRELSADDLVRTLSGVCMASGDATFPPTVVDLIVDGLRYRAGTPTGDN